MRQTFQAALAIAIAATLATPTFAGAAPSKSDLLAKEIRSRCVGAPGSPGVISAAGLWEAFEAAKVGVIGVEPGWRNDAKHTLADNVGGAVANAETSTFKVKGNKEAFGELRGYFTGWLDPNRVGANDWLPYAAGGVRVEAKSGPIGGVQPVASDVYGGSDERYLFRCPVLASDPAPPEVEGPKWTIAKTPEDLAKELDKKAFADLAFIDNIDKREESYSIAMAVGRSYPAFVLRNYRADASPPDVSRVLTGRIEPFVQYVRQGSDKADSTSVNNLDFGLNLAGRLDLTDFPSNRSASHYYTLTARYLTDDDFNSDVLAAQIYLEPQLPLAGYWDPYPLIVDADWELRADWSSAVMADVISVQDIGDKTKLKDAAEYVRLGYDLKGALRWIPDGDGAWSVSLTASYKVRDGQTEDGGDAQLFASDLSLSPSPHFSIGIGYNRGENLETFEFQELWSMKFGVRY